jgi:hypothetical protein
LPERIAWINTSATFWRNVEAFTGDKDFSFGILNLRSRTLQDSGAANLGRSTNP